MSNVTINSKIYPQDYVQNIGSLAIKLPMNASDVKKSNTDLFNLSYTTEEQAISNFINLLLTKDGERFMQPALGVGLYYYVFEQATPEQSILLRNKIEDQASQWLPYIIIKNVEVNVEPDSNSFNILITFSVTESGANIEMSFRKNINDGSIELGFS